MTAILLSFPLFRCSYRTNGNVFYHRFGDFEPNHHHPQHGYFRDV